MLKKFLFSIFIFSLISSFLAPLTSQKIQADGWTCKVDVYDERGTKLPNNQPTSSTRAIKMVIHAGVNAKSGKFTVALTNTGAFWQDHDLIPILTETTTSDNGDIAVSYFGPNGRIADPNNSYLPTFPQTTYHVYVYDTQSFAINVANQGYKYFGISTSWYQLQLLIQQC